MIKTIKILTEIRRLRKQNSKLAISNIILTTDLRVIAEDPASARAKNIIAKYKKQNDIEKEIEQAREN
jgi:hypothetical protein